MAYGVRKGLLTVRRRMLTSLCLIAAVLASSFPTGAHDSDESALWSVTVDSAGTVAASFRAAPCHPGQGIKPGKRGAERDRALMLDLIDLRGVPAGWTGLISTNEAYGLWLRPGPVQVWQGNPDLSAMGTSAVEPVTSVPAPAWIAGAGDGDGLYTLAFDCTRQFEPETSARPPITLILDLQGVSP
jgi:hypothetical protein